MPAGNAVDGARATCIGRVPHAAKPPISSDAASTRPRPRSDRARRVPPAPAFWQHELLQRRSPEVHVRNKCLALMMVLLAIVSPSYAALDIGDAAPNFTAPAALNGKVFEFSLAESLAKGPVVVYFFPAAFSVGCSAEAHEFAEAIDKFRDLGATVIGVSGDDIETLGKFSVQACQGRFPVASDATQRVMKSYDAVMTLRPEYANRISYVIAPGGTVVYHYQSLNPTRHVEKTLAAVQAWAQAARAPAR